MRFADYAKMYLKAGDGGAGEVHFRREKFVAKGGPDGGAGGKGGDIILRGSSNMNTLLDLRYKKFVKAEKGKPGEKGEKTGRSGEPVIFDVPLGTVAFEAETRRRLGEITEEGQKLVLAKGGEGGLGNASFKSPTNQTPRQSQPGHPGEEITVEIELKLMADVGLVGFPNAGKSTLLSAISAAEPKIADYPFTTLEPNLGVVTLPDYRSFVVADIPGIIEEAHQGKGLGIRFLRHIERNSVLLFVIHCFTDIEEEYKVLKNELYAYRPDLLEKPRVVAISQMDLIEGYELDKTPSLDDVPVIPISAATGHNMDKLKEMLWEQISVAEDGTA